MAQPISAIDPTGLSRLAQVNMQKRQLNIQEQEAARRGELQGFQIGKARDAERSRLATAAGQQRMQQGLANALRNIPEGSNQFLVAHSFLQNNGFNTEAQNLIGTQLKRLEQIENIDPRAADQGFNQTVGKLMGVTAQTTPDPSGKIVNLTSNATGETQSFRETPGTEATEISPAGLTLIPGFVKGSKPATGAGTSLGKLIQDREALAPDDPNRTLFDVAIRKEVQPAGAKEADKKAAQEFVKFRVEGGEADAQKQIAQLDDVIGRLGSGRNLTGPVIGRTPDIALSVTNPEAIDTREIVEEVVQRNLRLVLGAQFTEKEGERLISRAFNPRLDEETNIRRVTNLVNQMRGALAARTAAADFFGENKTLEGFDGKLPTLSDFKKLNLDAPVERPIGEAPGAIQEGIRFLGFE